MIAAWLLVLLLLSPKDHESSETGNGAEEREERDCTSFIPTLRAAPSVRQRDDRGR